VSATYRIITEKDYSEQFDETHAFALDILVGLSEQRKCIPSKYMYDDRGSSLFKEIMQLDEYYLTQSETEILTKNSDRIGRWTGESKFNLVELGAGDGVKTMILIDHFLGKGRSFDFVPIDISEGAMKDIVTRTNEQFPELEVEGLVSDYFNGLKWLNNRNDSINFVLFLGSSIGNFTHAEARLFLRNMWSCLDHGDVLLLGFDLKKDIELLLSAYNDCKGVTARFNLNVLKRINRELGGQFDINKFRHFGTYDVFSGAMESYLVSLEQQQVFIEKVGLPFEFAPWEPIHMEYSYKYLMSDIEELATETGFIIEDNVFDTRAYFVDSIWRVEKPDNSG
jgi:dimethylhistidine N-methyltransferase